MTSFLIHNILRRNEFRSLSKRCIDNSFKSVVKNRQISLIPYCFQNQGSSKKAKENVKITLLGPNNSISVVSLDEAQSLSRRRDLELIKIQDIDAKTQRPTYKLLTKAQLLSESVDDRGNNTTKNSSSKKGDKNLTIGSRISDHDLASRLKNISKWLSKDYEVRILIQCVSGDSGSGEKIYSIIETAVKEEGNGKILQKRSSSGSIKFNITPVKKTS